MSAGIHVWGAQCAWHGPIEKVGSLKMQSTEITVGGGRKIRIPKSSVPCCPHCHRVLFETSEKEWQDGIKEHGKTHPGYVELFEWLEKQPRCWRTIEEAAAAFTEATKIAVTLR